MRTIILIVASIVLLYICGIGIEISDEMWGALC